MTDFISDTMNSQFLGIPTLFWFAVFGVIIILVWKRKPKQKEFKPISADKQRIENYKQLMKELGIKVNKRLMYGAEKKGWIGKAVSKPENTTLYAVYKFRIARLFGRKPTYYIADNDLITQSYNEIIINPKAQYDNENKVIFFSKNSHEVSQNEFYKTTHEQSMDAMVNWIGLQTYLSVQHAQGSEGLDHLAEIEKTKRSEMVSEMTGKKKK